MRDPSDPLAAAAASSDMPRSELQEGQTLTDTRNMSSMREVQGLARRNNGLVTVDFARAHGLASGIARREEPAIGLGPDNISFPTH